MKSVRARYLAFHHQVVLALGIALSLFSLSALSAGSVQQRPLSDFLSAQGTWCSDLVTGCLFVPPDPNFLGWSTMLPFPEPKLPYVRSRPEVPLFAGVDYAGLAGAYAPGDEPSITGTVTERALPDGRAEVTVILHTQNANAWVIDLDLNGDLLDQIANRPTLFGHRPRDVLLGATQALADTLLRVQFINTAPGAPLPDVTQLTNDPDSLPGLELLVLAFQANATGPLTEAFGVPENTPGKMTISQVGLITKAGQSRVLADAFPVEDIHLTPISH